MYITFACDGCGTKYRVKIDMAGRQCKCARCGKVLLVPKNGAETSGSVGAKAVAHAATSEKRVAAVLARSGLADSAEAVIQQARAADRPDMQNDPMLDYFEANVRPQLGERDQALRLLRLYLEARPDRKTYLGEDWWWRPLRDDPGFKALVGDDE